MYVYYWYRNVVQNLNCKCNKLDILISNLLRSNLHAFRSSKLHKQYSIGGYVLFASMYIQFILEIRYHTCLCVTLYMRDMKFGIMDVWLSSGREN